MIKKLQALKKNKKGFTLVELIVVLVILAILAALLLPTLTRYIDKANAMKVESATRMVVMATKAEVGELYGKQVAGADLSGVSVADLTTTVGGQAAGIIALAEIPSGTVAKIDITVKADGEVTSVVYENSTYTCTYNGTFAVVKKAAAAAPTAPGVTLTVTGGNATAAVSIS